MLLFSIMIPRGICIDLETTITAKISDKIRGPGFKRFETRIIEIGACHWKDTNKCFMRLVNPITVSLTSGKALMQHLKDIHQKPKPTLNFWSKVLVHRKSLDRSMFSIEEDPEVWLARTPENRAKDFVRWFNGAHGPSFVSEADALRDLLKWTGSTPWLAHNGMSFDFKVLSGCAERTGIPIPQSIAFYDTLKIFRKCIPGYKSYSQPKLYEAIFSENYNAHVAIDDSLALARLCLHCDSKKLGNDSKNLGNDSKNLGNDSKKLGNDSKNLGNDISNEVLNDSKRKVMNLTFPLSKSSIIVNKKTSKSVSNIGHLTGIGPKSVSALKRKGVISLEDLKNEYKFGKSEWLKNTLPFGVNWRLVEKSIQNL